MVDAEHLDEMLKKILTQKLTEKTTISCNGYTYTDEAYTFWNTYKESHFLVEEMVLSKPLVVDQKIYDPTMRVIFMLHYFNGAIKIDYLASYWKLPSKSLSEEGTLTERHKSVGIIPVETTEQDKATVYAAFDKLLPYAYKKIINCINQKNSTSLFFKNI
jgi:hypothetical protein